MFVAIWKSSEQVCWYVHRQVSYNFTYCMKTYKMNVLNCALFAIMYNVCYVFPWKILSGNSAPYTSSSTAYACVLQEYCTWVWSQGKCSTQLHMLY